MLIFEVSTSVNENVEQVQTLQTPYRIWNTTLPSDQIHRNQQMKDNKQTNVSRTMPPGQFPPRKIPIQDNSHQENFYPENSHPENSHQKNYK